MHMNDEMLARLVTPPDVRELRQGTWLAQRMGIGAIGQSYWDAVQRLAQKESIHCDRWKMINTKRDAQDQAFAMREGLGELVDWLDG